MKITKWLRGVAATLAAVLALTALPAAASASEHVNPDVPWAGSALLTPEVDCTTLKSADANMEDLEAFMKLIVVSEVVSKDIFDAFDELVDIYKNYENRSSLAFPFEAQATWPEVEGATGYVVRSPGEDGEKPVYDSLGGGITWPWEDERPGHTIAPDHDMKSTYKYDDGNGGYAHLTYLIYAVNEDLGLRSKPATVNVTVTHGVLNSDPSVASPAVTCGTEYFDGEDKPHGSGLTGTHSAVPWEPSTPVAPSAACATRTIDYWTKARLSWPEMPAATAYRVILQRADGTVVRTAVDDTWMTETHIDMVSNRLWNNDTYTPLVNGQLFAAVQAKYPSGVWSPPGDAVALALGPGMFGTYGVGCVGWDGQPLITAPATSCENATSWFAPAARITWAPQEAATSYEVLIRTMPGGETNKVGDVDADATSFDVLKAHLVQSDYGASGSGSYAEALVRARTNDDSYAVSKPQLLRLTGSLEEDLSGVDCGLRPSAPAVTCSTIWPGLLYEMRLDWKAVPGATGYVVQVRNSSGAILKSKVLPASAVSSRVSEKDLPSGTTSADIKAGKFNAVILANGSPGWTSPPSNAVVVRYPANTMWAGVGC